MVFYDVLIISFALRLSTFSFGWNSCVGTTASSPNCSYATEFLIIVISILKYMENPRSTLNHSFVMISQKWYLEMGYITGTKLCTAAAATAATEAAIFPCSSLTKLLTSLKIKIRCCMSIAIPAHEAVRQRHSCSTWAIVM